MCTVTAGSRATRRPLRLDHRFGRRAETLPEDQLLLGLGLAEAEEKTPAKKAARAAKRRANRGSLPAHLPRIERVIEIESDICPCCSGKLHRIGEDVAKRLDMMPAQFRVLVVRRPKYACRCCEGVVVQAPVPARLIEGGMPTRQPPPRCWSQNSPTTSRFITRPRSTPAGASRSIARSWPAGLGARPSCSDPCTRACSKASKPRLGRRRSARSGLCLCPRSQGRAAERPSRRLQGHPPG